MNKKLVKRVAVASLAALMTIPNLNLPVNNVNTVYAGYKESKELLEKKKKELAEFGSTYSFGRRTALESSIKLIEDSLEGQKKLEEEIAAKNARMAAAEAQKAAEKAAIAEAHAMYGTHSFHGEAEVNAYLQQFKRHGSEKWDTSPLASSQKTVKQEIDSKFTNPGSTCYTKFMNKYGENPYFKGEEDVVRDMDFTLSFWETDVGLTGITDRAPHITMELMETKKYQGNAGIGNPLDIEDAIVKITYYSPIDGYLSIGGIIEGSGAWLDSASAWGNGKYVWGMSDNDRFTAVQSAALGKYYVCKGRNEFCLQARIHTYIAGTTTPAPGFEGHNHNYITQEMLNDAVQKFHNKYQSFHFTLNPASIYEEYIDD